YFSPERRRAFVEFAVGRATSPRGRASFEEQIDNMQIIAGTPKTVVPKLRRILEATRPGTMALWGSAGNVSHEDTKTSIPLLAPEVMPAMREVGQELGLDSPFEADAPVSFDHALKRQPAAASV